MSIKLLEYESKNTGNTKEGMKQLMVKPLWKTVWCFHKVNHTPIIFINFLWPV